MTDVESKAVNVKKASEVLYNTPTAKKNALLRAIAAQLKRETDRILKVNLLDLAAARKSGLSDVLVDRLTLTEKRIAQMTTGVEDVFKLPDPVGEILERKKRPNGLLIEKVRVPIGAVGIIYESRPNVTIDAAVLCLKAGNAVLLRGGSEAIRTNSKLVEIIKKALKNVGLTSGCVEFLDTPDRKAVAEMLAQDRFIDAFDHFDSNDKIKVLAVPIFFSCLSCILYNR